ncbi:flap endonuclease-1 [Methanococcus voltae]|uniref:flap endonuclease-1 n=1 Tax=Methanococcus voltae TaxID=2188 RepID=UPI001AE62B30|nr:flap endonuclease-1 [Methanococcus voltae]MBP2144184.1 flap endonuclease-1 [Methanococcus voltae]
MGVQLNELISKKSISKKELNNKKIAIDAMNVIYQFLSSIRLRDGTPLKNSSGEVTSAYNGIFYKTINMLEMGLTPIWVFDGQAHELKEVTREERRKTRQKALSEYLVAKKEEDTEKMQKFAKRMNYLDTNMILNCKRLLDLMGVPHLTSGSEGEAQCAEIVKNGDAFAVVSQDYDSLLYGADKVIKNMTSSGSKELEYIELSEVLEELGVTRSQLIDMSILIGTDYNPKGVKGLGPKKALDIVKNNQMEKYVPEIENYSEIRKIFDKPELSEYKKGDLKLKRPDLEGIFKFLVEENDFSEDRVKSSSEKLDGLIKNKLSQSSIDSWF